MPPRNARPAAPVTRGPIAPIHRGPQATSPQHPAAHLLHSPNAALLIDFDNVTMGIRSDLQTELKNLLSSDIIKGKVQLQRAYADWRRYPQYVVPLAESSIDMIMAPAYGSSKKNATDIRLAVDAIELVFTRPEIGTYILLSGDSDFSTLVIKLKEYGKYVIGVGIRESSSDLLVQNCDEYYSYNALAGLVRTSEEEVVKRDPWELAADAVQRMKKNGDVMRADRLKQVMQQIDASFDEKNLGMAKFSRFVSEAAQRGILSLHRMENGQYEVDLPRGNGSTNQPLPRGQESTESPAEERSRRGRRGGRGRGRGEERRPKEMVTDASPADAHPEVATESPAESILDGLTAAEGAVDSALSALVASQSVAAPVLAATQPVAPTIASIRAAPVAPSAASAVAPSVAPSDDIGISGMRLTRDEAFDLVRRAVQSLVSGDDAVRARLVRARARELLGRDSESLSERNFNRILMDAHDADAIDLRRRGDDYDVAHAVAAAPIAQQLGAAELANAPVQPAPTTRPTPRGMGHRGGGRGRSGAVARPGELSPELFSVGFVDYGIPATVATAAAAAAPVTAPIASAKVSPVHPPAMSEGDMSEADMSEAGAGAGANAPATRTATPRSRSGRKSAAKGATAKTGGRAGKRAASAPANTPAADTAERGDPVAEVKEPGTPRARAPRKPRAGSKTSPVRTASK